jgi:hypothetical protein
MYRLNIALPLLSKEMILDKDFGPGIRNLVKKMAWIWTRYPLGKIRYYLAKPRNKFRRWKYQ